MKRLLAIFILIAIGTSFIPSCSQTNDKKEYEETIATMSMEKAKHFFENYPESQYRDKLANEIIEWCKHEETEECYKMIIDVLPKNHPRYIEVVTHHQTRFGDKEK